MNKVLIAVLVLVLVAGGLYWFYPKLGETLPTSNKSPIEAVTTATTPPPAVAEVKETTNSLYDLKNSIQGVIDDSVQEEIQQAVESKINKSEEAQNK
ncbi:MAG: hypothetical protein V3U78_09345 [Thiotrichaceae bacterium]